MRCLFLPVFCFLRLSSYDNCERIQGLGSKPDLINLSIRVSDKFRIMHYFGQMHFNRRSACGLAGIYPAQFFLGFIVFKMQKQQRFAPDRLRQRKL